MKAVIRRRGRLYEVENLNGHDSDRKQRTHAVVAEWQASAAIQEDQDTRHEDLDDCPSGALEHQDATGEPHQERAVQLWHERLAHTNTRTIRRMAEEAVQGIDLEKDEYEDGCDVCIQGRMQTQPIRNVPEQRGHQPGEVVQVDLLGPITPASKRKNRWVLGFVDDYSRHKWVTFLKTKDQAHRGLKRYLAYLQTAGVNVMTIHADNGAEFYRAEEFRRTCEDRGVHQTFTSPYNPKQNGKIERSWQSILKTARCLMLEAGLQQEYWQECVQHATLILNVTPTSTTGFKTPHELLTGEVPTIGALRIFGCEVQFLDEHAQSKLASRTRKGIYLGEDPEGPSRLILDANSGRIVRSRNVKFFERRRPARAKGDQRFPVVPPNTWENTTTDDEDNNTSLENVPNDSGEQTWERTPTETTGSDTDNSSEHDEVPYSRRYPAGYGEGRYWQTMGSRTSRTGRTVRSSRYHQQRNHCVCVASCCLGGCSFPCLFSTVIWNIFQ